MPLLLLLSRPTELQIDSLRVGCWKDNREDETELTVDCDDATSDMLLERSLISAISTGVGSSSSLFGSPLCVKIGGS